MLIVIPSRGRATRQITRAVLPPEIRDFAPILVHAHEAEIYRATGAPIVVGPGSTIGEQRQFILEYAAERGVDRLLMLDDDLVFAWRREDAPDKFRNTTDLELLRAFRDIENQLNVYPLVSIAPREGGNRRANPYIFNTRICRVLGVRVDVFMQEKIKFTDVEFMEDFHVSLSLLTRGFQTCSLNYIVNNQGGSNTSGGCSVTRTIEKQGEAAHRLAALWPQFVTVVKKKTDTAWGGLEREDVTVQWKRAYESGPPRGISVLDQ